MTPYSTITYFILLAVFFLPIVIAGFYGKRLQRYNMVVTILFLLVAFSNNWNQAYSLIGYVIWQIVLTKTYVTYRKKHNATWVFYLVTLAAILPLVLVKVMPFFEIKGVFGFLGISYITFKNVQLLIDMRDQSISKMTIYDQMSFLLFFPTFSSGPIDRFKRFKQDLETIPTKEAYQWLFYQGINKIFLGILYKFIMAHLIYTEILQTTYMQNEQWMTNFLYMYAYSFYLFFDFAGYSAFAIGVSYLMGFKTPENFHYPFISRNIKDFWNRWHISLSSWFRDFVYMRFIMLVTKKKWIKNRYTTSYLGYILLFLIMGVWHGLEWHFIVYGLYHAALSIGFDVFERQNKKKKFWKKDNKYIHALSIGLTFHAVCFGFLIFSGRLF